MIILTGGDTDARKLLLRQLREHAAPFGLEVDDDDVALVGTVAEARRAVSDAVLHVVVDLRADPPVASGAASGTGSERPQVRELIGDAERRGFAVSVLFDRLTVHGAASLDPIGDLDIVFGRTVVDQAVEIRADSDLEEALGLIASHIITRRATSPAVLDERARQVPGALFEIGSVFAIAEDDYARARTRSLVSNRMGGFVADLREAYRVLSGWPLRSRLPWDPHDSHSPRSTGTGVKWTLDVHSDRLPNLQDVLNTSSAPESRDRLAGVLPIDDDWAKVWRSSPPLLLLTGESGTGKSLVAETLAQLLTPVGQPIRLEKVNCAALSERTWEHLMHGAAPGAWSDIEEAVVGQLARGAHGVLFLDELGDLPLPVQAALLTYLDERLVRPAKGRPFPAFQHIIAATNRDLEEGVNQRWFRNDLLARFGLRLEIPPLRERGVDDPGKSELKQLLDFLLQDPSINPRLNDGRRAVTHVSGEALQKLVAFEYRDGNFRELTEAAHLALRSARRRYSRLIEVRDVTLSYESRFRSDRDSHRIRVLRVEVPEGAPRALVKTEADLRLLAHRERRTFVTDKDDNSWVLPAATAFTTDGTGLDGG